MRLDFVDLYGYYGLSRPAGGVGKLRCYLQEQNPRISEGRRNPGILILPGGAYRYTSPREAEPVALRFFARGYSAFVLEYSCAPCAFPTALREAVLAMRYIRSRASELSIIPDKIAAIGFSAGGHLCGTLGTMYDCAEVSDLVQDTQARPDGLVLCYPVAVSHGRTHAESFQNISGGDPALCCRLSLDKLARTDMPPVFLWHTRDDESVPVRNALVLAEALEEKNVPFAMHIYAHGPHGLSTADAAVYPVEAVPQVSRDIPGWVDASVDFLAEHGFCMTDG